MRPGLSQLQERVLAPVSDLALRGGIAFPGADPVRAVLTAFATATAGRSVTFIQIGSNDGTTTDPLRRVARTHAWSGVLVEPVPYVFKRLERLRGGVAGIALENVAVSDHDGTAPFYYLRARQPGEDLPSWYDQIGSFSLDNVLKHEAAIPDLRARLITAQVQTLTFESLCSRHGLDVFDVLHLDTEGHDWQILSRVELDRCVPSVVLFEHVHLSDADRRASAGRLEEHGYVWLRTRDDTLGLRRNALVELPRLARVWRQVARQTTG